jgi:hypothetical protein
MSPLLPLKPNQIDEPFHANNAPGFARMACTNRGNQVKVWVSDPNNPDVWKYFCHGHALGTYALFGYTVFSGDALQTVLKDEWALVGNVHNAQVGDIVVWHGYHKTKDRRFADHSALILKIKRGNDGLANVHKTTLSSKNGTGPLLAPVSLAELIASYGDTYAVYRPQ